MRAFYRVAIVRLYSAFASDAFERGVAVSSFESGTFSASEKLARSRDGEYDVAADGSVEYASIVGATEYGVATGASAGYVAGSGACAYGLAYT